MSAKTPVTVALGDGIGPEITTAVLNILHAANTPILIDMIDVGEKIYLEGYTSGIPDSAWQSLQKNKVLLKGPITTPLGGGYKSLNVTLRKTLGLYANVRPTRAFSPFIHTNHPTMDLVIVRENEEGTYAGIEHRQTEDVYQCLKIVSRPGCERIVHYAFEYARKFNRKKVTCLTKDNIMKMTDGIFHQVFIEIAKEYPDIENEHLIIDIGTALVAANPEQFDVIVTSNLYGDILSDVAAQVAGSVGLAGSANIGDHMAMFEAIHGSAPSIAGKNIANPSGLLNAAIQMLIHINLPTYASTLENAWLKTLEDGIHTADIYSPEHSKRKASTTEFTDAVINNLGYKPAHFTAVDYQPDIQKKIFCYGEFSQPKEKKVLIGVDIFIDNLDKTPEQIGIILSTLNQNTLKLITITSRGLKIWPDCMIQSPFANHCSCRFQTSDKISDATPVTHHDIITLLEAFNRLGFDVIKTENLYTYDGKAGFSLAQGQ